jgi:hypothetical protein
VYCFVYFSLHAYICLFSVCVQFYRLLPQGGNPNLDNKYHILLYPFGCWKGPALQTMPICDFLEKLCIDLNLCQNSKCRNGHRLHPAVWWDEIYVVQGYIRHLIPTQVQLHGINIQNTMACVQCNNVCTPLYTLKTCTATSEQ